MTTARIGRPPLTALLGVLLVAAGCATTAQEKADRAACRDYARAFEHSGRMKDACLISRGYQVGRKWGGSGIDQFFQCMGPRGYTVTGLR